MYTILIADDESIIRQGLQYIIDWNNYGFSIIGEAANGADALNQILEKKPDLVLLDIRMPKLSGLEVVREARKQGFLGKVVILSGFSDFNYAKEAIAQGVHYYLTKPLEETELITIIKDISKQLEAEQQQKKIFENYLDKAKENILKDLFHNSFNERNYNLNDLNMTANVYQVLIYENYSPREPAVSYSFADLLRVTNKKNHSFDSIDMEQKQIILLKGDYGILRFQDFLARYHAKMIPQKGSPLDCFFIAYGRPVSNLTDIYLSYEDACRLMERRFFCENKQHTLGYDELTDLPSNQLVLDHALLQEYSKKLVNYIQTFHKHLISETLAELQEKLYRSSNMPIEIKRFLIDMYLMIKENVYHLYNKSEIPFLPNGTIIEQIEEKNYLYEIIELFQQQCEMIIKSIGNASHENIIDSIVHYIKHNYMNNIKLETIAPLFGYNSSYLGKIFSKKMGVNFNSYIDSVRIEKSKELLENGTLKVYEIAEQVGYQNVDYFHMKFKKYMQMSPAEYRKKKKLHN